MNEKKEIVELLNRVYQAMVEAQMWMNDKNFSAVCQEDAFVVANKIKELQQRIIGTKFSAREPQP